MVKIVDFESVIFQKDIQDLDKDAVVNIGTSCYYSPEMWDGQLGKPSEVYAFGCLIFEMASREVMWKGLQKPAFKKRTIDW